MRAVLLWTLPLALSIPAPLSTAPLPAKLAKLGTPPRFIAIRAFDEERGTIEYEYVVQQSVQTPKTIEEFDPARGRVVEKTVLVTKHISVSVRALMQTEEIVMVTADGREIPKANHKQTVGKFALLFPTSTKIPKEYLELFAKDTILIRKK